MKILTFDEFSKDIAEALKRADAWYKYDAINDTLHITSRNKEAPLTNGEKIRICEYLIMRKHLYHKVSFDDFEPVIDRLGLNEKGVGKE